MRAVYTQHAAVALKTPVIRELTVAHRAGSTFNTRRRIMTLCPIALAVGCNKCAIVNGCPLKTVIGNYRKPDDAQPKPPAENK
jgi:hypothetical protein